MLPTPDASAAPADTSSLDRAFPLSLPRNPLARALKLGIGEVMLRLTPQRGRQLVSAETFARYSQLDRCMLAALGQRAIRDGRLDDLQNIHRKFWLTGVGTALMVKEQSWRFDELFLAYHQPFVAPYAEAVARLGCRQIIEIGSGTGEIISHFTQTLPGIDQAHGIDVNPGLIERCAQKWQDPRLRFHCGDGIALLKQLATPRTTLLTYGGVLEYFLEKDVRALYSWLAQQARPCVVGCVEPIGDDLQLGSGTASCPFGSELSFEHDYVSLLRDSGFTIRFVQDVHAGTQRFAMVVAEAA